MAGLYAILGDADPKRLDAIAQRMRFDGESERRFHGQVSYVWLGHDPELRFAPAADPVTGVQVLVGGRLCWPIEDWQSADRLNYNGGTANRIILERYLRNGPDSIAPYNGAATILISDPRDQNVHLWTDQFGYHPAFVYGVDGEWPHIFTTFPDAVLDDSALKVEPDHVSMAEFLRAWRVTPPNTYYKNLKHAGAANYWRWNLNTQSVTRRVYWQPFEGEFFESLTDAADALAAAVRIAVRERTAVAENAVFFVSGGADSRVMLFAADSPSRVCGVNLYERPTNESAIARALCERVGAQYVGIQRDSDYYPRMQTENVRWSGAMWCSEDNHYLGVHEQVSEFDADLVMSACTTDWLFKGYGLEKLYRRVFGKYLPFKRFSNQRVNGFLPNIPRIAPPEFAELIDERMASWFKGLPSQLLTDRDRLLVEDRRIRPACYTVSVSGQIMYRTYPYDTFLADSRVAHCYSCIPAKWKLNGDVWGRAAGIICDKGGDIVDSNFGWAVNANHTARFLCFANGWIRRRAAKLVQKKRNSDEDGHPPSVASWPDFGWYATHSAKLRRFWTSRSADDRSLMSHLWGSDPWSVPLEQWASASNDLFRILTLLEHWSQISTSQSRPRCRIESAG